MIAIIRNFVVVIIVRKTVTRTRGSKRTVSQLMAENKPADNSVNQGREEARATEEVRRCEYEPPSEPIQITSDSFLSCSKAVKSFELPRRFGGTNTNRRRSHRQ